MSKKISLALLVVFALALSGCGQKQTSQNINAPLNQKNPNSPNVNAGQGNQTSLETTAPKTTNDLPTAIDETEKDLKVIDNDLKEIDELDMTEQGFEL